MLHTRRFGHGEPIVALHGFTLTGEQFATSAERLNREVVAPDLPGHGNSAQAPADIDTVVEAVCDLTTSFPAPVPMIGYSQGGRIALLSTLECPDSVSHLVLISANAGIDDDQTRRNRATQDDALAARIELIGSERFIDEWTAAYLTSTAGMEPDERLHDRRVRLTNTPDGLASALRGYGQGVQPVVWRSLERIDLPVLVVAGSRDAVYTEIAHRLHEHIAGSELVIVHDAGHNPLIDAPDITYGVVSDFLDGDGRS